MDTRIAQILAAALLAVGLVASLPAAAQSLGGDGIVRVKSAYPLDETVTRLKQDIAAKGIRFFQEVDQHKLAAEAGIKVLPSTLLVFGNPPLGTQFLNAKPEAGIDWPVRLLVQQDEKGDVWAIYNDFLWIARRHGIEEADQQPFKTASGVIASITSSVKTK
ncbi:MAG TPA: DUF302 domain-containing protein [Burkholderiales bacterium]|nr:DUF302 domain-containing protein [Burkholderiales bacterium]